MNIDEKVRDQKLRYDINMTAAKLSALLSGKIDKCEYLTGKKKVAPGQHWIIEDTKFTSSSLRKEFEKQTIANQKHQTTEITEIWLVVRPRRRL